jgi:hypothetical protein
MNFSKKDFEEITPSELMCASDHSSMCPAIFKTHDGSGYIFIGKKIGVPDLHHRMGEDEEAFFVPTELLPSLKK